MPLRGDFETEYDNDAEQLIADMEFKDDDTPWEKGKLGCTSFAIQACVADLKLKVLEIYNSKVCFRENVRMTSNCWLQLDMRAERKKFILERNLLEKKVRQKQPTFAQLCVLRLRRSAAKRSARFTTTCAALRASILKSGLA